MSCAGRRARKRGAHQRSEALALVERALLAHPFNDAMHELAVDIHLQQGRSAEECVGRVRRMYEQGLGARLPESILRPPTGRTFPKAHHAWTRKRAPKR